MPSVLFRSVVNFDATPDKPFLETKGAVDAANLRKQSVELDQIIEIDVLGSELQVLWSKDVAAHFGSYFQAKVRRGLVRIPAGEMHFEPAVHARIGGGSRPHNEYLYGHGAEEGVSFYSVGLSLAAPPQIDPFFPIFEVDHYAVLGAKNREAHRVADKPSGWSVTALFAISIF